MALSRSVRVNDVVISIGLVLLDASSSSSGSLGSTVPTYVVKLNLNVSHDSAVPSNCFGDFPNLVRSTLDVSVSPADDVAPVCGDIGG